MSLICWANRSITGGILAMSSAMSTNRLRYPANSATAASDARPSQDSRRLPAPSRSFPRSLRFRARACHFAASLSTIDTSKSRMFPTVSIEAPSPETPAGVQQRLCGLLVGFGVGVGALVDLVPRDGEFGRENLQRLVPALLTGTDGLQSTEIACLGGLLRGHRALLKIELVHLALRLVRDVAEVGGRGVQVVRDDLDLVRLRHWNPRCVPSCIAKPAPRHGFSSGGSRSCQDRHGSHGRMIGNPPYRSKITAIGRHDNGNSAADQTSPP